MVFNFCRKSVSEVICGLHGLYSKSIWQTVIYQHQIFYSDNCLLHLLGQSIFLMYIQSCRSYCYAMLLTEGFEFSGDEFYISICLKDFYQTIGLGLDLRQPQRCFSLVDIESTSFLYAHTSKQLCRYFVITMPGRACPKDRCIFLQISLSLPSYLC